MRDGTEAPFGELRAAMSAVGGMVERLLDELLPVPEGDERRVVEAMRYALFAGGKRFRPFLVVTTADLFGVARRASLRVGAAMECIHTYSLVHDDLPAMDDDDLRRGRPTVHKAYDEATAILAGDALLTFAFEILADEATHGDAHVRAELVRVISRAAGHRGMVGGQMIDLIAEHRQLDEARVTRLQRMKTGALIEASVLAGAILGKAAPTLMHHLKTYARAVGLAFQIADDLLDRTATTEELGKAAGKDREAGKATLVDILGPERAHAHASAMVEQAVEALNVFDAGKTRFLRELARYTLERRH